MSAKRQKCRESQFQTLNFSTKQKLENRKNEKKREKKISASKTNSKIIIILVE